MRPRSSLAALLVVAACGGGDDVMVADDVPEIDAPPSAGPWASAPAVRGGAIQETAAVAIDGKVYVLGGFDGNLQISRAVRIYDTAAGTWSDGPELPEAVHHVNAAVVDGTIYVVGFLSGGNFAARGDVWAWDPASDAAWSTRTAMPAGTARGSSITGVIDGIIYVAGGLRGGAAVADVSTYDPGQDAWDDAAPDLPAPRDHGCGGVIDGTFYVAGGRQASIGSTADTTWSLAPGGAWTTRAPMITGRGGTACGVVGGRLVVVGGEGNPDAPSGVYPQTEAYDPVADAWTSLPDMPTPRHGMGAAAWGDSLYVPGGADQQAFGAVDTHEVLTPSF